MPSLDSKCGLSSKELESILQILSTCAALKRAQLFGSRAMNTHRPTSDVDLALFGSDLLRSDINKLKIAFEDSLLPYTFDLIIHREIKEPELLAHIQRRGVDLYREGFYLSEDEEWIPEGWSVDQLDQHYDFKSGLSKPAKDFGRGHSFLSFKDIFYNYFVPDELTELVDSTEKEQAACSVSRGDVFLTRTSETLEELGMSSVATKDYPQATFNGFCKRLRPKFEESSVFPEYAGYYFRSYRFRSLVTALSSPSTRASLNNEMLSTLSILLPSIPEQKSIAAVLGSLDDKIELLREQNETLEALAQTLFKRWFIDFNFPDKNGNPYKDSGGAMIASELGEIPEGWIADKLDGYISISGGGTPNTKEPSYWDGEIAWSSPKDLSDRPYPFLFETNKTITDEGLDAISSGLNPVGSLLLSSRAPIGYKAFADVPVAVNQGYIVFAPEQRLSNQFMFLWLKKHMNIVTNAANGSTFLEISKKAIKEIETVIPNEAVLGNFQNLMKPHFEKLRNNLIQIKTLTQLRDTLLPMLMKGEVRVTA